MNSLKYISLFCLLCGQLWAQNISVSNLTASFSLNNNRLTVVYDLAEADMMPVEVVLRVSDDNGQSFLLPTANAFGDVGPNVATGTNRVIYWDAAAPLPISLLKVAVIAIRPEVFPLDAFSSQVDSARMLADFGWMATLRQRNQNPQQLALVKDSIRLHLLRYGFDVSLQNNQVGNYTLQNIIGKQKGLVNERLTYVIDGHYDAVSNSPAADDNASAVVGFLEAARILSQFTFRNSIQVVGFDLEEEGLIGSNYFVQQLTNGTDSIAGVINLEMIGYFDDAPNSQTLPTGFNQLFPNAYNQVANDQFRGNFITNVGNEANLIQTFDSVAALYVPALKVVTVDVPGNGSITPDLRRSDHASFWDANIPALMITDAADFRNPNYHSPNDTVGSLDLGFMKQVVQASVASMAALAKPISAAADTTDVAMQNTSVATDIDCRPKIIWQNDQLRIKWAGSNCSSIIEAIHLIDLQGRTVAKSLTPNQPDAFSAQISQQASGLYLLQLTLGQQQYVKKLWIGR
ncbi:MAG: M28 family peptidase [Bacteroidota bacterium]